jgi:hypothetical protein
MRISSRGEVPGEREPAIRDDDDDDDDDDASYEGVSRIFRTESMTKQTTAKIKTAH